jgi:hypothetical protein
VLYPSEKLILFLLLLIFEDAEIVFSFQDLVFNRNVVMEIGSIFKKQ